MERALDDDMDVLNMSIGDAFNNWHQSPTGQASTNLVKRGMVVVASIGNSGANGVYSGGVPGMGDKVIGVASFDNSHVALNYVHGVARRHADRLRQRRRGAARADLGDARRWRRRARRRRTATAASTRRHPAA